MKIKFCSKMAMIHQIYYILTPICGIYEDNDSSRFRILDTGMMVNFGTSLNMIEMMNDV